MDKKYKKEKQVFENISKNYIKMEKKFIQFFQDRVLANKKAPAGRRTAKKKFLKNISKGGIKRGSTKRDGKKMVMDGLSL